MPAVDPLIARLRRQIDAGVQPPPIDKSYMPEGPVVPAAVLVPVILREAGPTLLLTVRTAHLRDHAGQISFPGGRSERSDVSAIDTALRESEEEVGLRRESVEILGCLPHFLTITGFIVTPVIGLIPPLDIERDLTLDAFEVAQVFEVPLAFVLDQANHVRHDIEYGGKPHHYWSMPWQEHHIWGATAGMIRQLSQVVHAPD
jgi:8-oxo-dGTP pyrophosphatase MutT (NUDIX family)